LFCWNVRDTGCVGSKMECVRCKSIGEHSKELNMDLTTLLIIVVVVLLLGGGGWYGRGRWY
jgi:hypothetical protein